MAKAKSKGFWAKPGSSPLTAPDKAGKRTRLKYGDPCDGLSAEHHKHYAALGFISDTKPVILSKRERIAAREADAEKRKAKAKADDPNEGK